MTKGPARATERDFIVHPRTADQALTRFYQVLGSIALKTPPPSAKTLFDEDDEKEPGLISDHAST